MRTWPGEDDGFEGLAEVLGEGLGGRDGSPQYRWGRLHQHVYRLCSQYQRLLVGVRAYG